MPDLARHRRGRALVIAGHHHDVHAHPAERRAPRREPRPDAVDEPDPAQQSAIRGHTDQRVPCVAHDLRDVAAIDDAVLGEEPARADEQRRRHRPHAARARPCPGTASNAFDRDRCDAAGRARARRSLSRADGSIPARARARSPSCRAQSPLRQARRPRRPRGRPSVSVPVLSTTSVESLPACSSAIALRIRIPSCAPRPVPTTSAVGVASPSAHGHAMTSTATACTSARVVSSVSSQVATNVIAAIAMTTGTKTAETRSTSRWIGAFDPCASATSRTIPASSVCAPTPTATATSLPSWFTVPAKTLSPGCFTTGSAFAGEHALVDARRARFDEPVDRHGIAGAHDEAVAGAHALQRQPRRARRRAPRARCAAAASRGSPARPTCPPSRAPRAACRAAPA